MYAPVTCSENFGASVLEAVAADKEVTVARQVNGVWVDLALPCGARDSTSDEQKNETSRYASSA